MSLSASSHGTALNKISCNPFTLEAPNSFRIAQSEIINLRLSKFEIIVITLIVVRIQAIADLLSIFPREDSWNITDDVPSELLEIVLMETSGAV